MPPAGMGLSVCSQGPNSRVRKRSVKIFASFSMSSTRRVSPRISTSSTPPKIPARIVVRVERDTLALRYCVDDPDPETASFGGSNVGRSPRNMRVTTLGDWMKEQRPETRVFAVS